MVDTKKTFERFLQRYRFRKVKNYLIGNVLDFGGNDGELEQFVAGEYTLVNYNHSPMHNKTFNTIVLLAVIEHIEVSEVSLIFKKFKACLSTGGTIFLTTPTPAAKIILEILAFCNILDKENIAEHKHYWNRKELSELAETNGFTVVDYKQFQLGFNQCMILKHQS
jgi:cyclopropane fatty-acyl-phospholipid synthase-like methyltransferase